MTGRPHRKRLLLRAATAFMAGMVLAAIVLLLLHRSEARAWRQAVTIAAALREVPVASRVVGWFDHEPAATLKRRPGGLPATLVRPDDGEQSHPTIVLLVPGGASAGELHRIREVQRALARAGIAAWALRSPDQGTVSVDDAGRARLRAALSTIADQSTTRGGTLAVAAAGPLASVALVTAAEPAAGPRLRAVLAVQPLIDARRLLRRALTGTERRPDGSDRPVKVPIELRVAAGRALVDTIRQQAGEAAPARLRAALDAAEQSQDPIATLRSTPRALVPPNLRAALSVVRATTPAEFDRAWDQLSPDVRALADAQSPARVADGIDARVLLVIPHHDSTYPSEHAYDLAASLRDARVHATAILDGGGAAGDAREPGVPWEAVSDGAWWLQRAGA